MMITHIDAVEMAASAILKQHSMLCEPFYFESCKAQAVGRRHTHVCR